MTDPNNNNSSRDLAGYYGYTIPLNEFFRCALSVDCVVFGYSNKETKVLLIKRGVEPYKGEWALPGDLMYPYENLSEAAQRVLKSLTGIDNIYMEQLQTFGEVSRHPIGRVITVSYFALVNIEDYNPEASSWAENLEWHNIQSVPTLAFDHNKILSEARESLKQELRSRPIAFKLLSPKFTLNDVQDLYESILNETFDKANFRKKLLGSEILVPLDETRKNVSHRPAKLYKIKMNQVNNQIFQF